MKKIILLLAAFLGAFAADAAQPPTTGRLVRSDCAAITDPMDYGVDCLQSTNAGGRLAGHVYVWRPPQWVDISAGGTGGAGVPGGSNTQVQYNAAGVFAGDSGLTYNATTDVLTVFGGVVANLTGNVVGNVTGNVTGSSGTTSAFTTNPNDCSPGQAAAGITATGAAEGCFDIATQAELDAHTSATTAHGSTSANTASTIVQRNGSGNFSAGTITANLTGNVTGAVTGNASTATALAADGSNCPAGQAAAGVDASGAAQGCTVIGAGAGVPVTLDLGNNGSNESADLAAIATTGDTNSIFTEPTADKLLIDLTKKWPAANTADLATAATALNANGSNCAAGSFAAGVDASGAAEGCTVLPLTIAGTTNQITASAATGNITLSIPTNPTLPGTTTGTFSGNLTGNVTGTLSGNASTATALAANGTNCSAGQAASGVDAQGNAEGCASVVAAPGGSNTQVQFNNAGALAGDAGLTYNAGTDVLTATGGFVGPLTGNVTGNITGNAATATALAANPSDCAGGTFAVSIDAAGNLTCSTPIGAGDVTGPASSVNGQLTLFNGTTGKQIVAGTQTGILSATSGVVGTATAGTDYVTPAGNVATATALSANPGNCTAGLAPAGIAASGAVEGCTDFMEEPSAAGIVTKTAANTSTNRAITTTTPITVTDGNAVAANPVIACPTCGVTGQPLSQFGATTSAQLAGNITNETGSGALVFGTSPTLTTPIIADFTTSQHNHSTAALGGKITPTTGLNTTGTPTAGTVLKGDNSWGAIAASAGGTDTQCQRNNAGALGGISGCTSDGTSTTYATDNLRATNPRITTGLRDTSGNQAIGITATPSAVNGITITNAATGGTPTIAATGSDTNIGINLAGQGTGAVCIGTSCTSSTTTVGSFESGNVKLNGTTSGTVTIQPGAAAAGTYNFNMPTTAGTAGNCLISGGGGATANTWGACGSGGGVSSIAKSGSAALTGAVTLSQGTNVTLTQTGNDISIASSGGGSSAFNTLTSGTNTTAAMTVGSGGSMTYTGTGTINATTVAGNAIAPIAVNKTANPASSDNTAAGYPNGSMWINTTASPNTTWVKTSEAAGVASWSDLSATGGALTASSTDTFTNKTIDASDAGNVITLPFNIWLPAAGGTVAAPAAVWNLPATNPAVAAVTAGTNTLQGTLDFADGASELTAQIDWLIPDDWIGTVRVQIRWLTTAASGGPVIWKLYTSCSDAGGSNDVAWNTANTVTQTPYATASLQNIATIDPITTTGCSAGSLLHLKIGRDPAAGGDTLAAAAKLIGVALNYRRTM